MSTDLKKELIASAIKLESEQSSSVLATGKNNYALDIINTANQHGIPVIEDFLLSKQLQEMPVGIEIPDKVFFAITQIMEYIDGLDDNQVETD